MAKDYTDFTDRWYPSRALWRLNLQFLGIIAMMIFALWFLYFIETFESAGLSPFMAFVFGMMAVLVSVNTIFFTWGMVLITRSIKKSQGIEFREYKKWTGDLGEDVRGVLDTLDLDHVIEDDGVPKKKGRGWWLTDMEELTIPDGDLKIYLGQSSMVIKYTVFVGPVDDTNRDLVQSFQDRLDSTLLPEEHDEFNILREDEGEFEESGEKNRVDYTPRVRI